MQPTLHCQCSQHKRCFVAVIVLISRLRSWEDVTGCARRLLIGWSKYIHDDGRQWRGRTTLLGLAVKFCYNFNAVQTKGVKLVSGCIKRTCYKEMWNILTWPSSVVRNGSSSRTQFLPKRPRQLRSGCGGTFWPSSAQRIGPQGVQSSKPWTINCGLFWEDMACRKRHNSLESLRRSSWRQRQRPLWRRSVWLQKSGRSVSRLASRHRADILSDITINENLKLLQINYLARKVDVLFHFPYRSPCTC